jgi:replicative DNA helicase
MEAAVLGAMLVESPTIPTVLAMLRGNASVFYQPAHQLVFQAISDLHAAGKAVDILTVVQQLRSLGKLEKAGTMAGVAGLTAQINSAANIATHCAVLLQLYTKRRIGQVAYQLLAHANNPMSDALDLLTEAYGGLNGLNDALQVRRPQLVGEVYDRVVDSIVAATSAVGGITGVPSGLSALDRITGGWQPGTLIIEAARPGMGKTSLMLATGRKSVAAGRPGMISSLEMGVDELVRKLIATELGYTTNQLTRGLNMRRDEAESIRDRAAALRSLRLVLDDTPGLGIDELRAKAAKAKQEHDIEWLAVDYLQLMTARGGKGGNREQEISAISRGLKLIAKELYIPVIALAQLSRAVETRGGDKKPQLSDLRESGAIEQDADVIIFPYRAEYYKIEQDEMGNPTQDITELIVAKHRSGGLGSAFVKSVMRTGAYSDLPADEPYTVPAESTARPLPTSTFEQDGPPPF